MKYLLKKRKKNRGIAIAIRAAAICRLYRTSVVPLASAITTWTVCVFGEASDNARKNSFQTWVKMMIATEA